MGNLKKVAEELECITQRMDSLIELCRMVVQGLSKSGKLGLETWCSLCKQHHCMGGK